MDKQQTPSYFLDSERELTKIDDTNKESKIYELKKNKEDFEYLKDIPIEILNSPDEIKSTPTQVRYLYKDELFDLEHNIDKKYTPEDINELYNKKCEGYEQEEIKDIKRIIVIGDIHGDYKMLIHILKKYEVIIPSEIYKKTINITDKDVAIREKYKNEEITDKKEFEFNYKLNPKLKDMIIIQVGDQLTGYREFNKKVYEYIKYNPNEDEKVLIFMNTLKEQSKELNKTNKNNIHIISLIGNHEFTNLRGIYSKCSEKDSSCIENYTSPDLRKDRRAFIKHELKNILCGREYFFSYNGFVFAHSGLIHSLIERLNIMFPHLDILENLKKLNTLDEKIDYYNKLIKLLIFIKIEKIKDDDISIKKVEKRDKNNNPIPKINKSTNQPMTDKNNNIIYEMKDIYNSIDDKIFADLANSKDALNNKFDNITKIVNLFHLYNMIIGHEMMYDGVKFNEYKVNDETIKIINTDTGLSNSFFNKYPNGLPNYTFPDRLNKGVFINPAKNNQLLKQILIIDFDDDNKFKSMGVEDIEHIKLDEPYIIPLYVNPDGQKQIPSQYDFYKPNPIYN